MGLKSRLCGGLLLLLLGMMVTTGCTTQRWTIREYALPGRLDTANGQKYPRVDTSTLFFEPGKNRTVTAGRNDLFPFLLRNTGSREVYMEEWYMLEDFNVKLRYREVGTEEWHEYTKPYLPDTMPTHVGLHLKRSNIAKIEVELPFVRELPPGTQKQFEVIAFSNLESASFATRPFILTTR